MSGKYYQLLTPVLVMSLLPMLIGCGGDSNKADAYGTFEVDEVRVSSKATGELVSFSIEEGMRLPADSSVGYVDSTELHLQRAEIEAALRAAHAKQLTTDAQMRVTQREREQLKLDHNRIESMYQQKAATQKQLEDITTALDLASKRLELLGTQYPAINAEISNINARKALLEERIHNAVLINPINGIVLTKFVQQHELISPGKPLYTIADMSVMYLKAFVSGPQLSEIKLGQHVRVYTDLPDSKMQEHDGVISWISSKAEFTPKSVQTRDERVALVYAIKVRVKNSGTIQIGMPGEARWR